MTKGEQNDRKNRSTGREGKGKEKERKRKEAKKIWSKGGRKGQRGGAGEQ